MVSISYVTAKKVSNIGRSLARSVSRAQVLTNKGYVFVLKFTANRCLVFNWLQAQLELDFFTAMFFPLMKASPLAPAKSIYYIYKQIL